MHIALLLPTPEVGRKETRNLCSNPLTKWICYLDSKQMAQNTKIYGQSYLLKHYL